MSFIVTGLGRCGTTWLARELAKGDHVVKHEGAEDGKRSPLALASAFSQRMAGKANYGEVNSYLRFAVSLIDVDHYAMLTRHPDDIWASAYRWRAKGQRRVDRASLKGDIEEGLRIVHRYASRGARLIRLEDFKGTEDVVLVGGALGIRFPEVHVADMLPANRSPSADTPPSPGFEWFSEIYYPSGRP